MNRAKAKRLLKEKARDILANHWDENTTVFFGPIIQAKHCLYANYVVGTEVKAISVDYDANEDNSYKARL